MRQPVDGTFLAVYTAVPVRLAALPDTLLSTYETNPGDLSPHPCNLATPVIGEITGDYGRLGSGSGEQKPE